MPNIKAVKIIGVAVLVIACMAFFGLWRYAALQLETAQAQLKTANSTIEQHEKNKVITEEVAHEYENTIAGLNAHISRLQRQPVRCHTVTGQAGGTDAATTGNQLPAGNGVSSNWLYDFAGRCERERLKVKGLQSFVNRLYND